MTADFERERRHAGLARVMIEEVWSRGDLAALDYVAAPGYVARDSLCTEASHGREAVKRVVASVREAIPDLKKRVEELFVDGEAVIVRYTATGTHEGDLLGIEATGRPVSVPGVVVYRVEDGLLAAETDLWDAFGLCRQLGALPDGLGEAAFASIENGEGSGR